MPVFRVRARYQGKPCRRVEYRRSDGLRPEAGYVDMDLRDLGKIKVFHREVPWAPVNGDFEAPGQISISTWSQLVIPSISDKLSPQPDAPDEGLEHFGTLSMQTFDQRGGELSPAMDYNFVYVADTGIEEVGPQIARVRAHDSGIVRVPLTDIRQYYRDHGLFCTRINVKDDRGIWDPATLNATSGTLTPWTLDEVVRYLFGQLPGTPLVIWSQDVTDSTRKRVPTNLIGQGEPVVEVLEGLLAKFGLVPKMQPSGNYVLGRRGSRIVPYGAVPVDVGDFQPYPNQHYETRSQYTTGRAPLWVVVGSRRVRRITIPYVPVLEDEDGIMFQLKDVEEVLDYKLEDLNKQVFAPGDKQYEDCPPRNEDAVANPELRRFRIEMLKRMAYKAYLPATVFSNAFTIGPGVPAVSPSMLSRQPFLPLVDAAWTEGEIAKMRAELPLSDLKPGDQAKYAVFPPVVRAKRVGEGWFKDFEAVRRHFDAIINPQLKVTDVLSRLRDYLAEVGEALKLKGEIKAIEAADVQMASLEGPVAALRKSLRNTNEVLDRRARDSAADPEADFKTLARLLRISVGKEQLLEFASKKTWEDLAVKDALEAALKAVDEAKLAEDKALLGFERSMEAFQQAYERLGPQWLEMNLPWDFIPGAESWIDRRTGLLIAPEPLCHMEKPFVFQGSAQKAVSDGAVVVTAGFEVYDSSTGGLTMVLFSVGAEEEAEPIYAGMNRPSALKGKRVAAPKLRLYQNDLGTPLNAAAVVADARDLVAGEASQPLSVDGHTYTYNGLVRAVLDGGCNSIQHVYDADRPGETVTWVAVNAPGSMGPIPVPLPPTRVYQGPYEFQQKVEAGQSDPGRGVN